MDDFEPTVRLKPCTFISPKYIIYECGLELNRIIPSSYISPPPIPSHHHHRHHHPPTLIYSSVLQNFKFDLIFAQWNSLLLHWQKILFSNDMIGKPKSLYFNYNPRSLFALMIKSFSKRLILSAISFSALKFKFWRNKTPLLSQCRQYHWSELKSTPMWIGSITTVPRHKTQLSSNYVIIYTS